MHLMQLMDVPISTRMYTYKKYEENFFDFISFFFSFFLRQRKIYLSWSASFIKTWLIRLLSPRTFWFFINALLCVDFPFAAVNQQLLEKYFSHIKKIIFNWKAVITYQHIVFQDQFVLTSCISCTLSEHKFILKWLNLIVRENVEKVGKRMNYDNKLSIEKDLYKL